MSMSDMRLFGQVTLLSALLAGCASTSSSPSTPAAPSGLAMVKSWFTPPPPPPSATTPVAVDDDIPCPRVEMSEGGSTLREGTGSDVKLQFSIRDIARECSAGKNGTTNMKIGIEGVAVIGKAGKPGPASASIIITAMKNDKVIATKVITAKVTIAADDNQALFRVIEPSFTLPAGAQDAELTAGFKK